MGQCLKSLPNYLEARVLLLSTTGKEEEDLITAILARAGIACVGCPDPVQVCEQLTAGAGAVLITEEALHGGDDCLAEWLGRQPLWSDLPILVLARAGASSAAVAPALEKFGNVTVLERPTQGAALVSAVRTALRARQRQYQIRDQLVQRDLVAEQLRASENRFRLAAEAVNGIIYEYDITTGHVECQRGLYEVLGYHAAEVPRTAAWWREQIDPDDLERIELQFMALAGNSIVGEYRVRHRDGRWLHVEDRAVLQRGDDGRPVKMVGCTVDVTAQKQADAERRRQETFTSGILGSITDGFGVVCKDWRFTFANDELVRRIGKQRDEILGNAMWDMFPDAVGNHAYVQLHRAMAERVTVEYEVYYEPWQRWMLEKVFPTADGGLAMYTRDITERKRVEQALADRTELLNGVLEGTTDVIFVKDLDGRLLLANTAFAAAARSTPELLVGKTDEEWFPPDVAAAVRQQDEAVIAGGSPMQFEDTVPVAGEARSFLTLKAPLRDGGGRVVGLLGIGRDITERKRAEAARQETERNYQALAAASSEVAYRMSADWSTMLPLNGRELFVSSDRPFADWGWVDLYLPRDEHARVRQAIRDAIVGKNLFEMEHRVLRLDGSTGWVRSRSVPILDENENVIEWFGTAGDITERKAAEVALRENEERLQKVISVQNVGVLFFKLDGHMQDANGALQRMSGYTAEELRSITDWAQLTPPEFMDVTRRAAAELAERGVTAPYEKQWIRKDGSRFWGLFSPTRLSGSGSESECVEFTIDITERKRAEETLRQSETRLSGILRRSPAGIFQTDAAGCMTLVNPRWCELLGYLEAELLGRNIIDITHPSFVAPTAAAFGRLAAGGPDFQIEKDFCRKDGSILSAQSNAAAIRSPDGEFLGLITVVLDISERLRAEAELRRLAAELLEADRRKDVFLATLAHELRNPLAPIRNGLQLMKLAKHNEETLEKVRAMMDRQLSQLVRLVDDLLDVSRITQGKVELRKERTDLKAVIDAAEETSRQALEQAGHDLVVVVPDEPIFVDGDATRLAQVVSNLLNNSAKYTHRGGHIRLSVGSEGGTAVVSVKDNGIGIPPAMLDKVFVMFTQVDRTLEKTTGGLGIGLSLAKGLLEMHGGTIEAKSDGEGMGSEFVVRLPVMMDVVAEPDRPNGQTSDVVPSALRRILVVDDNEDAADSLSQLLKMSGHDVRTANDGETGIEAAAQFRPDLVLMDIGMPKLNGYEAARRIRQHPWGRGMVLVALTGWGHEDDRKKSAEAGFDHHLVKPVKMQALMKLMSSQ